MNLESFRSQRTSRHQKKMSRYLTYVFNDHFVIVLLFLAGAGGYFYSSYLKQLQEVPLSLLLAAIGLMALFLFPGDVATLLERADILFLAPMEFKMPAYFKKMKVRSLILPFLLEAGIIAIMMPLFVLGTNRTFGETFLLILTAWALKSADMQMRVFSYTQSEEKRWLAWRGILWSSGMIIFSLSVFLSPYIGLLAAVVFCLSVFYLVSKRVGTKRLQWEKIVKHETERLSRQYRLLNLFTDVPLIETTIKRNKLMDKTAGILFSFNQKKGEERTFDFLYQTVFTRNPSYRNLYLRLLLIGILLQIYSPLPLLNSILGVLFLYLIGFQLIPLSAHFSGNVFTSLYPISYLKREDSLVRVIGILLYAAAVLQGIAGFIALDWRNALISFAAQVIFCFLFTNKYLPVRVRKLYS